MATKTPTTKAARRPTPAPQDATMRNVRAAHRKVNELRAHTDLRQRELWNAIHLLEERVAKLEQPA